MRTRCPSCGATLSLDALIAHDAAREALAAAFKLSGQLGSALVRYLALFRPESRELTMDRVARLVGDLLPDLQAQRISRNGQVYDAPLEAWVWAIEQALAARDAGRLTRLSSCFCSSESRLICLELSASASAVRSAIVPPRALYSAI